MAAVCLSPVSLCVLWIVISPCFAKPVQSGSSDNDIKEASQLAKDLRKLTAKAKSGIAVRVLYQDVLELQSAATHLILQLPGQVSECETNLVIKMAATGTGSHEALTLLLADDTLSVLSGRLSLSLTFLERLAQQLEDQLAFSNEVGPHLAAIVFGTNVTASIAKRADETVKAMTNAWSNNSGHSNSNKNRIRRQLLTTSQPFTHAYSRLPLSLSSFGNSNPRSGIPTSFNLGNNWKIGLDGLSWEKGTRSATLSVRPTFDNFKLDGFRAKLTIGF